MKKINFALGSLVLSVLLIVGLADRSVMAQPGTPGAATSALQTALNALVTTANTYIDNLEGLIDTTNGALATIDGRVDGLETLITATNSAVDGIEGLLGTTNTNTGSTSTGVGGTTDAAATAGSTGSVNAKLRLLTTQLDTLNGLVDDALVDPCQAVAKTTTPISATSDLAIITAVSAKKNHICAIDLVVGAAEILSIWEGTGTVCGTGSAAIVGSTTEANGMSFAANGGIARGDGSSTVYVGKTANVDTCLRFSGSNRAAGSVTWVQQ